MRELVATHDYSEKEPTDGLENSKRKSVEGSVAEEGNPDGYDDHPPIGICNLPLCSYCPLHTGLVLGRLSSGRREEASSEPVVDLADKED